MDRCQKEAALAGIRDRVDQEKRILSAGKGKASDRAAHKRRLQKWAKMEHARRMRIAADIKAKHALAKLTAQSKARIAARGNPVVVVRY